MKYRNAFCFVSFFSFGFLFVAASATAQSIAYRQTNLASSLPNVANNATPGLVNPWGIAFLSGQPFFIADNRAGRVTALDGTGLGVAPGSFIVPNAAGTGFDSPTGIVADQNSFFGSSSLVKPFILVTDEGTIFTWGLDARGDMPPAATQVVNNFSQGAVYKAVAILNSSSTPPALAVTDFHGGFIQTFLPGFVPVALPGSFSDPGLPPGYAPFGIQVIGSQVFVSYAVQDAAKHDPVVGAGNGIVSIFDLDGNFVRRFATGGTLNAPWGIAQAGADFGPFSNDILIGNVGDGAINAFDPRSGQFVGQLLDGDGLALAEVRLHGLVFRTDGFGDRNTLYFTSQFNSEEDGLFGAITPGLVSIIRVTAPDSTADASVRITAEVAAGPGNPGAPTGTVTFLDGSTPLGTAPLVDGTATLDVIFSAVGSHAVTVRYSGDGVFLPSSQRVPIQVTGLVTMLTLVAPTDAVPGSTVILTATINSTGGIPTGEIVFRDGNATLGSAPLDGTGVATLRVNTLAAGSHSLSASYDGDEKFGASTSAPVTINIANPDFALGASPSSAMVIAGQSTQFILTVTPAGGFANTITFSCSQIVGITCAFSPATVTTGNGAVSTTLTVTTSASVSRYGMLTPDTIGPWALLFALGLCSLAIWTSGRVRTLRPSLVTATVAMAIVAMGLAIGGCGGYGSTTRANRGTATVMITAQSGTLSHSTSVTVTVQ